MIDRNEFLFNILMVNEIPFVRLYGDREFLLLDHKVRISVFAPSAEVKFHLLQYKYKDIVYESGEISGEELSKILGIDWIKRYSKIII